MILILIMGITIILVSRYIWDVEIVGSSPATPTNIFMTMSVSSSDFHSEKSGSTPGIATKIASVAQLDRATAF